MLRFFIPYTAREYKNQAKISLFLERTRFLDNPLTSHYKANSVIFGLCSELIEIRLKINFKTQHYSPQGYLG